MSKARACSVCGCTELMACETEAGPCHWVAPKLCSNPSCIVAGKLLTENMYALLTRGAASPIEVISDTGAGRGFARTNHNARMATLVRCGLAVPNVHGDHYITPAGRTALDIHKGKDNAKP